MCCLARMRTPRRLSRGNWPPMASRSGSASRWPKCRREHDGLRLRVGDGLQAVPFGQRADVDCTHLLIAVGRSPNVDDLDLPAAGIAFNADGVVVDDRLRTTNRRVFAAGDVCSTFKFTHAADALARIVIQNALFFGRKRASALVIPWCTYTDPEVAHVGQYEDEARSAGRHVETITIPLTDVDRAVIDDERDGFVRVHHERGRLLGCTVVASRAGEMIAVAAHALTHGASLSALGSTIHPYPTLNNAFRAAGDVVFANAPHSGCQARAAAILPVRPIEPRWLRPSAWSIISAGILCPL